MKTELDQALLLFEGFRNQIEKTFIEEVYTIFGREIPCKEGCAACCFQLPFCFFSEAQIVIREERHLFDESFCDRLYKLAENIAGMRSTYENNQDFLNAWFNLKIPCLFLKDERCSIYKNRPLTCRLHIVIGNKKQCKGERKNIKTVDSSNEYRKLIPFDVNVIKKVTGERYAYYAPFPIALANRLFLKKEN